MNVIDFGRETGQICVAAHLLVLLAVSLLVLAVGLFTCYLTICLCWNYLFFFFAHGKGRSGSKPKFQTDGGGQCQRRPGREAGYKVGPSERQTTHS